MVFFLNPIECWHFWALFPSEWERKCMLQSDKKYFRRAYSNLLFIMIVCMWIGLFVCMINSFYWKFWDLEAKGKYEIKEIEKKRREVAWDRLKERYKYMKCNKEKKRKKKKKKKIHSHTFIRTHTHTHTHTHQHIHTHNTYSCVHTHTHTKYVYSCIQKHTKTLKTFFNFCVFRCFSVIVTLTLDPRSPILRGFSPVR